MRRVLKYLALVFALRRLFLNSAHSRTTPTAPVTEYYDLVAPTPPPRPDTGPRRIGDILIEREFATAEEVANALEHQRRSGSRLGELLLHAGSIDEYELASALALQRYLPLLEDAHAVADPRARDVLPEEVARRHRFVPLEVQEDRLVLAAEDSLSADAEIEVSHYTTLRASIVIAPRDVLDELRQRVYGRTHLELATHDLVNRTPEESAHRVLDRRQKFAFATLVAVAAGGLALDAVTTIIVFNAVSLVFYTSFSLYKLRLIYRATAHDLELPTSRAEVQDLDERDLPVYTILVPLYREVKVLSRLVDSIAALDYPRAKLDVKLLLEEDDVETIAAARAMRLPACFRIVVVPDGIPKTKPKACNYGLMRAEGEFVVIYDAEDRPDPDQLKKVVVAFAKADRRIRCIQCKLNYFNRDQNLLTRWFTTEYSMWFDLLMPGLDAANAPIPLGGTSNHFPTRTLLEMGAWDPFNVTEDADLGIRLHKQGYRAAVIDATTYEEANSDVYNWIRQRSRWVKGYVQTWLVHMRHPLRHRRQIGLRNWLSFQLIVGGTVLGFLLNPFYWLLTTLWALTAAGIIHSVFPSFVYFGAAAGLYFGNFVFTYANVLGAMRREHHNLVKSALLSPIYWGLMSLAAWKGVLQLSYRPFYWEKTNHGLDEDRGSPLQTQHTEPAHSAGRCS
jgi:cellulose synthase/poly-beta-1,6-N-acetylglucosamine synthase-like glycosyltransferase